VICLYIFHCSKWSARYWAWGCQSPSCGQYNHWYNIYQSEKQLDVRDNRHQIGNLLRWRRV